MGDKLTLILFAVLGVKTKSNCRLTFENKKNNLKQFYVKQNSLFQHKSLVFSFKEFPVLALQTQKINYIYGSSNVHLCKEHKSDEKKFNKRQTMCVRMFYQQSDDW